MRPLLILLSLCLFSGLISAQLVGDTENGLASYYSKEYHGAETAYGVVYDKNDLVAAHRQFPQNSVVSVKNLENNKSVQVRIIDKGPFIRGRIIELSERAASRLDMIGKETVPVEITLISTPDQPAVTNRTRPAAVIAPEPTPAAPERSAPAVVRDPEPAPAPAPRPATPTTADRPVAVTPSVRQPQPPPTVMPATVSAAEVKIMPVGKKTYARELKTFAPGTYKIEILEKPAGAFGVQVGSFKDLESAMDKVAELQGKWFDNILVTRVFTGPASIYKVVLGPFAAQDSATRYAADLKKRYKMDGFTVTLEE